MPERLKIDFTHYYRHHELADVLTSLAESYPNLAKLHSIGKSHQGRDLWLIEITSEEGGPAEKKSGYYIDAMTHAEELAGSVVALYTAWFLLTQYGADPTVTRLLDRQTFYILPMVNPDGAEVCLTLPFYQWIGNGRYQPGEEQLSEDGLHYEDINQDGQILDMRWLDPMGEWKISEQDDRLLIPREPDEYGGEYYRVLPEGVIWDYDGADIKVPRPMDGNLNRNYPGFWGPEGDQYGAGEHPLSEPEIEAVVRFVQAHPNIVGAVNYHTNAGAILTPTHVDGQPLPREDAAIFKAIGEMGVKETGYFLISDDEEFNFPGAKPRMGTSDDFLYGHLGIICFVTELWDVFAESGIEKDWFFSLREMPEQDSLKLLKWNDERLGGEGFMEWTPFDHPQLGKVEIGGWKRLFMFRNPPGDMLEEICHKNALFTLRHAGAAPQLHIARTEIEPLGEDTFRVAAAVENWGYLSTHVTEQAIKMAVAEPIVARIECGDGVKLVSGLQQIELGHLAGRSNRPRHYSRFFEWKAAAGKAEWVVKRTGEGAGTVSIVAVSQKGGADRKTVHLE